MISPLKFITLLEERGLLSSRTAANLREQIEQATEPITAAALAKRLIKKGKITSSQAKRILGADADIGTSSIGVKGQPKAGGDLGFAAIADGDDSESPQATPRKQSSAAHTPSPAGSLFDDETPSQGMGSLDGIMADNAVSGSVAGGPLSSSTSARSGRKSFWSLFSRKPKGRKKTDEEKWGGGLMLVGGGGLIVLLLVCGLLLYASFSSSADKRFKAANDEYDNGSYNQAITKFRSFLEQFPTEKRASLARVRIGLSSMRQATSGSNMSSALEVAEKQLDTMTTEPDFKEAHDDVAAMLSTIAVGLATEAMKKPTAELADKTKKALAMFDSCKIPKEKRPESKLAEVRSKLAIIDRDLARGEKLDKAIAAMEKATKELKTADAYSACSALIHQYPDLAGDARLRKTLLAVSLAQQALVKTISETKQPVAEEAESGVLRSVTLAQGVLKNKVPDGEGVVVLAAVDGAVYGLDAATGRVIWRRFIGFDANPNGPAFPPTALSSEPGSDVIAVDTNRNEILRIEGTTGRLRWRHPVGEAFDAPPVIAGDKIFVATKSGKLITIVTASGKSPSYIKFPQNLDVAPCIDVRRSLVYQVAAHTNLFVLSLDDGLCKHVAYLGHEPASIIAAPVVVDEYLLVSVNDGARDSAVKIFTIQPDHSDKPESWLKPIQEIRLGGHLQMSPLVEGRRVLTATDTGVVRVFELSATDAKVPFREVAQTAIDEDDAGRPKSTNLTRFAMMQNGQFWIADNRLTKYDVQAARGRLTPKWIDSADSAYLQPPVAIGQTVVSVRRKIGMPGAIVSAIGMEINDHLWDTQIASPLAGSPLPLSTDGKSDGRLVAVTANGGVFRTDSNKADVSVVNEPILTSDPFRIKQPVTHVVSLAGGLLAISDGKGGEQVGVFDPANAAPIMSWVNLKCKLACAPAALGRGLLVPSKAGQVFWLDPQKGDQLAEPFQPRLEPGMELDWTTPAVISDTQVVLSDGKTTVYLLSLKDQPKPHLEASAQTAIAKPIASPLGVVAQTGFVADTSGALTVLGLPTLAHGNKDVGLGGRCVWGPVRVGENVFVATDANQLLCFDSKGKEVWRAPLENGPLAGAPLLVGNQLVFASRSGIVWKAEAATGKGASKTNTGCPLATGPVLCGQKLLVGGHDGTIYEVRLP
jgi:outer membrane protein assembly factor BamB/TolA-binding protein